MAIIEQSIDVYVNSYGIPPRVHMPQGDTGRLLRIRPEDYEIPSGATASVKFKRPNESYFSVPAVIRNNYADADATQLITTAGDVKAMLQIEKDGEVIKSFVFVVVVHANTIGAPETPEQGKLFDDYVREAQTASAEAQRAAESAESVEQTVTTAATAATTAAATADTKATEATNARNDAVSAKNSAESSATSAAASAESAAAAVSGKQDKLTAGYGIKLTGSTISVDLPNGDERSY